MQLTMAMEGKLSIEIEDEILQCESILINKNIQHRILTDDKEIFLLLFEPILDEKYKIVFDFEKYMVPGTSGNLDRKIQELDIESLKETVFKDFSRVELDKRIQEVIRHIEKEEHCKHTLDDFAEDLHLSKGRISHLFKDEIGVSLKHYILWKKLLFAIDSLRLSSNLSDIALDCGFSDLSHLSRTFKNLFGHKPSEIFQNSSSVQVEYLE